MKRANAVARCIRRLKGKVQPDQLPSKVTVAEFLGARFSRKQTGKKRPSNSKVALHTRCQQLKQQGGDRAAVERLVKGMVRVAYCTALEETCHMPQLHDVERALHKAASSGGRFRVEKELGLSGSLRSGQDSAPDDSDGSSSSGSGEEEPPQPEHGLEQRSGGDSREANAEVCNAGKDEPGLGQRQQHSIHAEQEGRQEQQQEQDCSSDSEGSVWRGPPSHGQAAAAAVRPAPQLVGYAAPAGGRGAAGVARGGAGGARGAPPVGLGTLAVGRNTAARGAGALGVGQGAAGVGRAAVGPASPTGANSSSPAGSMDGDDITAAYNNVGRFITSMFHGLPPTPN